MSNHHDFPGPRHQYRMYWIVGLGSLIWLVLRSGSNPRRLTYPCQRAALASSAGFLGYPASLLGTAHLYRRLKRGAALAGTGLFALALLITAILTGSQVPPTPTYASAATLPGWTGSAAVSNVFVVPNVPVPECSLDGGTLPGTAPCNTASYALHDAGVDKLVTEMETRRDYFYQTAAHPNGIVGANDVVVIKINNQWGGQGDGNGSGRLSTNTDLLKGLIWRILQHPDSFTGEVVVAENTQDVNAGWNTTPANAEDQNQSYQDVVNAFKGQGYAVSFSNWDDLNNSRISGGNVGAGGYPTGEYAKGNMTDAYILLEDPAGTGADELSYPKFRTAGGSYVSMRYGVWNGISYDAGRLAFINMPVLKKHGMAGSTIAWKNLIGFVTIADNTRRFGGWDTMHDFFWGDTGGTNRDYGLIGRELALVRAPDLNVVDAIWVATDDNTSGNAVRQNVLLASSDPFAVDWYASEYVLRPVVSSDAQDSSAARSGTFRSATRTNQNAAASVWPGGGYPYIDLLDSYDGSTPSDNEKKQMNVYVVADQTATATPTATPTGTVPAITPTPSHVYLPMILKGFRAVSSGWWKPAVNTTWQWQLEGPPLDRSFDVGMYDIDLFDNDASTVATLHAEGRKVVCYISAGSWEDWRPDAAQFPAAVTGKDYEGWAGEKWLDIRQIDQLAPIMRARLDQCKTKGFDGLEPDNIDGYTNDTGFPLTYQDQLAYNLWLANEAHTRGLSIGLKNDGDQVGDLLSHFDWALTEDCFADDWCADVVPFVTAGKTVFTAEYTDTGITLGDFCAQAATMKFSAILKHRALDAWRQACP